MSTDKNREQLRKLMRQARALIEKKEYDKARAILERIDARVDNPTVKKWLVQLDKIAPKDDPLGDITFPDVKDKPEQPKKSGNGCRNTLLGLVVLVGLCTLSPYLMGTTNSNAPLGNSEAIQIESALRGLTDVNISSVQIADGRANGGERGVIISYTSTANNEFDLAEEWGAIFTYTGATIQDRSMDLDAVTLVIGDERGDAVAIVVGYVDDLMAYMNGDMDAETFLRTLTIENF